VTIAGWFAVAFGALTLISGGTVLFGPDKAASAAGAVVQPVLWFNFLSGGFYILAGIGVVFGFRWGQILTTVLALCLLLLCGYFAFHVLTGNPYEMRTLGALVLRTGFWVGLAIALVRRNAS